MPLSIPYNPSLALGNIIDPDALATLLQISACQALVEAAHDKLRSFISLRRSIDLTIQELADLNIDTTNLIEKSAEVGRSIITAATGYSTTCLEQETKIQELKTGMQTVNTSLESPVDYDKSKIREMPLSADSLTMDMQYFSFDDNQSSAGSTIATIKDFIDASTSVLGDTMSGKIQRHGRRPGPSAKGEPRYHRHPDHLEASCTHRNALIMSPLVLDVDKAVAVWNELFPGEEERIDAKTPSAMRKITVEPNSSSQSIGLLSGATYGSSFVGMVHILKKETAKALPRK